MFSTSLLAQSKTITGTITDAKDGTPLSGVSIEARGHSIATTSKTDGSFNIVVPADTKTITFSYIGYADIELAVADNMTVKMTASEKSLNEVLVVGYGKAIKRTVTGSIAKLNGKEVENTPTPSFESALQGKAAGVVIESGSGKVGQGIKIRIRGTSSISASSQPLYVVDGLPVTSQSLSDPYNDDTNPLVDINPNDIESIEVLKDASAAAIYGARAANGVILITTKKGRNNQKTSIDLNVTTSISNPARKMHFLDANQYISLMEIAANDDAYYAYSNGSYSTLEAAQAKFKAYYERRLDIYSLHTWRDRKYNTNWQDLLYNKNAPANEINLSASGGDAKTKFFVSGFYNVQDATVINNKFYRYGGRLNLDHTATDKLSFGINLSVDRSQLNRVTNDDQFSTPGQLVAQLPISPLYDPKTGGLNKRTLYPNGLFDAQFDFDKQVTYRTIGNVYANYNILKSLTFRSEFGADILSLNEDAFQGKETVDGEGIGKANTILSQSTSFNTNNYLTYTPDLKNDQKVEVVGGMSYLQNDLKQSNAYGEGFPSDAIKNLSGASSITSATSSGSRYAFLSYFLRGNYSFQDKYLFSGSIRTDASSRFGPNNRYGWFPAVSAGWVLSEEKFLKDVSFINFLKLRASWGLTGNSEIGEDQYQALYGVSNYPDFPGFVPVQLGNPDLHWERTAQTDIGVDFTFLNNRITTEFDVYKKRTSDLLLSIHIPATTGYLSIYQNIGNMENKGFEGTISSENLTGKFRWTTSVNFGYNKNKVLNIGGQIIESGFSVTQRAIEGEPIGVFYGQKFLGVDPQTGDAQYLGEDGKPTDFGSAARVVLGNGNPEWTGGITNTFSYKGFDLNIFFSFVSGVKVNNAAGYFMSDGYYNGFDNQTTDILNAWQKPGDITNVPRIGYWYGSGYQPESSRWLYDGSYLRLKNVTLGYALPKSIAQKIHISSARLYVSGSNLWITTKYPGDPEVNTETLGNIGSNQDFYTIPQARTFTLGLSVKF